MFPDQIKRRPYNLTLNLPTGYCWCCSGTFFRFCLSGVLSSERSHVLKWANDVCQNLSSGLVWSVIRIPPPTSRDSCLPLPRWNTSYKSECNLVRMYASPYLLFPGCSSTSLGAKRCNYTHVGGMGLLGPHVLMYTYPDRRLKKGRNHRSVLPSLGIHHCLPKGPYRLPCRKHLFRELLCRHRSQYRGTGWWKQPLLRRREIWPPRKEDGP